MNTPEAVACQLKPVPGHPLLRVGRLLEPAAAAELMDGLLAEVVWNDGTYLVAGRSFSLPRLQAWYADPGIEYRYARQLLNSHPWSPILSALRSQVEAVAGQAFNAVLVNLYRNGRDWVGWHADDEPDLGPAPVIASLSLGASRCLSVRAKGDDTRPEHAYPRVCLGAGELLMMDAPFQRDWQHGVLADPAVDAPRMNLTFRRVVPSS